LFRSKWMSPTTIQHRRMIINSESQPLLIKIGADLVSMRCNCGDRGRRLQLPDQPNVLMRRRKTAWIMRMVTMPALDHVYPSQVHITRKKGDCEPQSGNAKNRLFICSHTHLHKSFSLVGNRVDLESVKSLAKCNATAVRTTARAAKRQT